VQLHEDFSVHNFMLDAVVGQCRLKPADSRVEPACFRKWWSPPIHHGFLTLMNGGGPSCTIQRLTLKFQLQFLASS